MKKKQKRRKPSSKKENSGEQECNAPFLEKAQQADHVADGAQLISRREALHKCGVLVGAATLGSCIGCKEKASDPKNETDASVQADGGTDAMLDAGPEMDSGSTVDGAIGDLDGGVNPIGADVVLVKNGTFDQNISQALALMGGIAHYVNEDDIVVIKGNGQWPNHGYTHTGCIRAVIDEIFAAHPSFSGEILICDNVQAYGSAGQFGFDATPSHRNHNWHEHNWNELADFYHQAGRPVAVKRWFSASADSNPADDISSPANGEGWIREFFEFHSLQAYLSYPVFESPLTPGRFIDPANGVWEGGPSGDYTGRRVRVIQMPTLNYHGHYAGVTSAIKSTFGSTEIINGAYAQFRGAYNIHYAAFTNDSGAYAARCGELVARHIQTFFSPVLYLTAAIWVGHNGRWSTPVQADTVLGCLNPATLDYVACRDVLAPLSTSYGNELDPTIDSLARRQIEGCVNAGVGTINEDNFTLHVHDFTA